MKFNLVNKMMIAAFLSGSFAVAANAQDKTENLKEDAERAKQEFIQADPSMSARFDNAYGYAIFPNVGKGAVIVGGAAGNAIVYENGTPVGKAALRQVTAGFQMGAQAYREVIFFESKDAFDRFTSDNLEFAAQVSAVAATKGASANAEYANGVMVFTQQKGGLMYEASIGGQKFEYTPF